LRIFLLRGLYDAWWFLSLSSANFFSLYGSPFPLILPGHRLTFQWRLRLPPTVTGSFRRRFPTLFYPPPLPAIPLPPRWCSLVVAISPPADRMPGHRFIVSVPKFPRFHFFSLSVRNVPAVLTVMACFVVCENGRLAAALHPPSFPLSLRMFSVLFFFSHFRVFAAAFHDITVFFQKGKAPPLFPSFPISRFVFFHSRPLAPGGFDFLHPRSLSDPAIPFAIVGRKGSLSLSLFVLNWVSIFCCFFSRPPGWLISSSVALAGDFQG